MIRSSIRFFRKFFSVYMLLYGICRVGRALFPVLMVPATGALISEITLLSQEGVFRFPVSLLSLLMLLFLSYVLDLASERLEMVCKQNSECRMREELYGKLVRIPFSYFENSEKLHQIQVVFDKPDEYFQDTLHANMRCIEIFVSIASFTAILASKSMMMVVLFLLLVAAVLFFAFKSGHQNYEAFEEGEEIIRRNDYLESVLLDREYAIERAAFEYNERFETEWLKNNDQYLRVTEKPLKQMCVKVNRIQLISFAIVAIFAMGLYRLLWKDTINGAFFISAAGACFNLIALVSNEIFWTYSSLAEGLDYFQSYADFLSLQQAEEHHTKSGIDIPFKKIEIKNLTFTYPSEKKPTLHDLSLTLEYGKTYALVGANGCGKSTFVKLLLGLYTDYTGEILIDGKELRTLNRAEINSIFGVAFQDFTHLEIPIEVYLQSEKAENILPLLRTLGFPSNENILSKSLGKLSEDGVELSGGEWQKMLLARVLLNKISFKILDEPTAAIDPEEELRLYERFDSLRGKEGALLITHRLGASIFCDTIYVMDDGHIVEEGSHLNLLKKDGLYADMFRVQGDPYENE